MCPPSNPNKPDEKGNLELHSAALLGSVELIELLLTNGGHINHRNVKGITPLHLAVRSGKPKAVTALLAAGANPKPEEVLNSLLVN